MPLPEKEYFALKEIEERWGIRRLDTIYYAENGLLEIAMRVVGITIETGLIEPEPDGGCYKVPEDYRRYSGLLTLCSYDLALLLRRGSATIHGFDLTLTHIFLGQLRSSYISQTRQLPGAEQEDGNAG